MVLEDCYFIPKPFAVCEFTGIVEQVLKGEEDNTINADFFRMSI